MVRIWVGAGELICYTKPSIITENNDTMDKAAVQQQMDQAIEHFNEELKKVRTGRASSQMLENLNVEVYGAPTPLSHAAQIIALDSQTLQIQPFDPGNLAAISKAIRDDQQLGLNLSDDGKVVRVSIPPMTEERRLEVVKSMGVVVEETRIRLRQVRHDALDSAKKQEKAGDITQDDLKGYQNQLDEMINDYNSRVEAAAKEKEAEIMKV